MAEAYVQLQCPECGKDWEADASDLPSPEESFQCPDCREYRPLSEFARTARDLETMEQFA